MLRRNQVIEKPKPQERLQEDEYCAVSPDFSLTIVVRRKNVTILSFDALENFRFPTIQKISFKNSYS